MSTKTSTRPYGLLIKPVSGQCNLSCHYCFYRHQKPSETSSVLTMNDTVLERLISDYLNDVEHAAFAWQGGEPTLAGISFYQRVLELQQKYKRESQQVTNALQTNGTLLTDEWARFLTENDFLVGISIDGREQDHDRHRKNSVGQPSFAKVMAGLNKLRQHKTQYNVLAVVTPDTAQNSWKLYSALKKFGTPYLQFIPLMESPEDTDGSSLTLTPELYGKFLCECFDYWHADLSSSKPVSIRTFDNAVGLAAGIPSETCVFQRGCPISPVIESDGSVYPCDFFVTPEWRLGNLLETPLPKLVSGHVMQKFLQAASEIPEECIRCPVFQLCNGGCMAERLFAKNNNSEVGRVSYYCQSYRSFFAYAYPKLRETALRFLR